MTGRDLSEILSPPEKRSLADEVTSSIREAILGGRLAPGERLREESLAKTLNVSRGPVRTAILQLQREGLVSVRRNYGTFVAHLSQEDLDEVYSLRLAIERLAVQLAIQKADSARLAELQAVVDMMAAHSRDYITEREAAELDLRFHEIIYLATGHRRLSDVWSSLRPQIHILLLARNVANADFRDGLVKGHQAIVDAIRQQDESLALALTDDHLKVSYERVSRSYAQFAAKREKRENPML
jgi:DNA-binding GntR family transcriptional regulator